MRLPPPSPPPMEADLTPLINIVFLLLIFFMLAGALTRPDPFRLEPPATEHGQEADPPRRVVAIAADGRLAIDGQRVSEAELRRTLKQLSTAHPNARLRLKPDRQTTAERLLEVTAAAQAAGITDIVMLTRRAP